MNESSQQKPDMFRFGDAWWADLVAHCNNRHEYEKREDIAAEAREEEGAKSWENFNPFDWSNDKHED